MVGNSARGYSLKKDLQAAQWGAESPVGWGGARREDLAGWQGRWVVARHVCFSALALGVRLTSLHVRTGLEGSGAEKTCSREIQATVEPLILRSHRHSNSTYPNRTHCLSPPPLLCYPISVTHTSILSKPEGRSHWRLLPLAHPAPVCKLGCTGARWECDDLDSAFLPESLI